MASQQFKGEHIHDSSDEEVDCSYLLNMELDFDENDSDVNV